MPGIKPTGRHQDKRLSALFVRNVKEQGFYGDGHGLYLKVDATGAKRWVQRLVIQGKRRDIGLGSADAAGTTLAEAREQALQHRKAARAGDDPLAAKKRSTALLTFEAAAQKVHDLQALTWRNEKHGKQWLSTLETFAYPLIGSKRIDVISSADVLAVLTHIWNVRPETARRVKQRIGTVMKWAMAQGWRTDNPPTRLPRRYRSMTARRRSIAKRCPMGRLAKQ